jgi:hypothetical protein
MTKTLTKGDRRSGVMERTLKMDFPGKSYLASMKATSNPKRPAIPETEAATISEFRITPWSLPCMYSRLYSGLYSRKDPCPMGSM